MAPINRVRVVLTGFVGQPGVSTFFCLDPATFTIALRAYYASLAQVFPSVLTADIEDAGDILDDVTGTLTGAWVGAVTAAVQGTAVGTYAAPAGAVVNWLTSTVVDGSRLRGKTFLVPLAGGIYQDDGSLSQSYLGIIRDASTTFSDAVAANFVIWHRNRVARPATPTKPAQTQRDGSSAVVTGVQVNDRVAVLRSRRD